MPQSQSTVFISYAREDKEAARRLYADLKKNGAEPWFDEESLLPGQKWRIAIKQAIRNSRYFLAVLSSNSVSRRGYVHKEMAEALDVLDEFPESEIFIIPIRLDDCSPSHERLRDLQWVDMFPSWKDGFEKILHAIGVQPTGNGIPWNRARILSNGSILPEFIAVVILAVLTYALSSLFPDIDDNLKLVIAGVVAIVGLVIWHYVIGQRFRRFTHWLGRIWAILSNRTKALVSTIKSFFRSTWGRRVVAFCLLLGLLLLEYARSQLPIGPVALLMFSLQLLLLLGLVLQILHTITSPVLVYDFIDKFEEATLRNEGSEEIRPFERALSKRDGGTAMRAIYAHPGHQGEDTEVTYQLPAEFAAARHLFLVFAVAVLGEHPVDRRGCGFKDIRDNRARFEVRVNGKTVFARVFDDEDPHLFQWEHHVIPITEGKGQTLEVDLITNAMENLEFNWTAWGEPKLIAISST